MKDPNSVIPRPKAKQGRKLSKAAIIKREQRKKWTPEQLKEAQQKAREGMRKCRGKSLGIESTPTTKTWLFEEDHRRKFQTSLDDLDLTTNEGHRERRRRLMGNINQKERMKNWRNKRTPQQKIADDDKARLGMKEFRRKLKEEPDFLQQPFYSRPRQTRPRIYVHPRYRFVRTLHGLSLWRNRRQQLEDVVPHNQS
jgi:hypothetical protein